MNGHLASCILPEEESWEGEDKALLKSQTAVSGNYFVWCQPFFSASMNGIFYGDDRKGFVALRAPKLAWWAA